MRLYACDEARVLLAGLPELEISLTETRSLEAHLAGCAGCTALAGRFLAQDRRLAEKAAEARIEQTLLRIRASIHGVEQKAVTERVAAVRRPAFPWGWAVAAAALVAASAAWFLRPEPPRDLTQAPAPKEEPVRLPGPPPLPAVNDEAPAPPEAPPVFVVPRPAPAVAKKPEPEKPKPEPEPELVTPAPVRAKAKPKDAVAPAPIIELGRRPNAEAAVRAGLDWLRTRSGAMKAFRAGNREAAGEELVLWTLVHSDVPEADPDFQRLLKSMLERRLERTYAVALQAMILEDLDRVKYQWRIHQCAQFLVDNQGRNGQWGYGDPSVFVEEIQPPARDIATSGTKRTVKEFSVPGVERPKPPVKTFIKVVKRRDGPDGGDHSNSMYAALGLRACHDAGLRFPQPVVEAAFRAWRDAQIKDPKNPYGGDGWCYGNHEKGHKGYGSMTAGAVGSLVIYDYLLGRDWRRTRETANGVDWLARNFSVVEHPGPPEHGGGKPGWQFFYYMYALERAAILYGTDRLGTHEWYPKGVESLLDLQRPEGSWVSKDGGNETWDTCFAILFLRRAVPALPPPLSTGGARPK
jgi:hypothetical protein